MSAEPIVSIEELFGRSGPLAAALAGFEARPGQVQMSKIVERGFLESAHTIVEAGTGVGKSLAYLVPALRSGKKVVISTATIALQEQLVRKDIPLVVRALGVPARVELLKGRNHYLCRSKLDRMRTGAAGGAERFYGGDLGLGRSYARRRATGANCRSRPRVSNGKRSTPMRTTARANSASVFATAIFSRGATRRNTPTSSW